MALTDKLTAIGNAIREKTGGTDLLTLDQMATEIANISGGGGEAEHIVLSGDCKYACCGVLGSKYLKLFGNTVSTANITNGEHMFYNSTLKSIPFALNFKANYNVSTLGLFSYSMIEEVPVFNNFSPTDLNNIFSNCNYLRNLPDNFGEDWDWDYIHNKSLYANISNVFMNCYSLRSIPESFLNNLWGKSNSLGYSQFYNGFYCCYALNELKGLRFNNSTMTSNMFSNAFNNCYRLKDIIFGLEKNGSVQTVKCKSQTIDLNARIGYGGSGGITADKRVSDDATYQALKDDPDYWTTDINYSRYNHDSAVRTINSLPDTSAYLATAGGTNTIKLKGASGALTDGGAINTLTEEEIAVATAKGWTVSLV